MKKKKLLTSVAASALAITSVIGIGATAFAANNGNNNMKSGKAPTAEQIASHDAQRAEKMDERLTQAVADGAITEDQKTAILEFFKANKPEFDPNATREENKAAMDAFKDKVESFAEANEIDLDLLKPAGGPGGPEARGENRIPPTAEERKAHQEERLTQAVADGKITEAQKAKITAFFSENEPAKPSDSASETDRKASMDAFKEKVDAFAKANNIDTDVLKPAGGPGGPGMHRGPQGG